MPKPKPKAAVKRKAAPKTLTQKYRFNKVSILAAIILLAAVGVAYVLITHASGPYVFLSPSKASPYVGSTFTVQVYEQSGTTAINAVEANIIVPAAKVAYVSENATGSKFNLATPVTLKNGVLSIAAASTSPLTGQQLIAAVKFKALAAGSLALNFGGGTAIIRASDAVNVLSFTQGVTYTLKTPPATVNSMAIYPSSGTVSAAKYPQVAVNVIEQTGSLPMNTFETVLGYPTNLVSYDHIVYHSGFSQAVPPSINNGVITFNGAYFGGQVTGPQAIATVYFTINAAGTAKFSIEHNSQMIDPVTATSIPITTFGSASYLLKKP